MTVLLYSGEQTDATGIQYLRARYYDPATGRFNRLDPFAGSPDDPQSLHKYLYVRGNPISGTDPSGEFWWALLGMAALGGVIGGVLGGIDAWLGDEDVFTGAWQGAAMGAALGGLGYAFPAVFASSYFTAFGMGFSIPFIVDAFARGKNAQGAFRVFTGIAAPLAIRNAAIARLASGVKANLLSLWNKVKLRTNAYAVEPGITGAQIGSRININNAPEGRFIYVVDESGQMWLGPIAEGVNHSSLVPAGSKVCAAGVIEITSNRTARLNSASGHFMAENPILAAEQPAWLTAITQTLLEAGIALESAYPGIGRL